MTKRCTRCGVEKPLSDFYRSRYATDGHKSQCKQCADSQVAEYRQRNLDIVRERKAAYDKKYAEVNREHRKAYRADYYAKNAGAVKAKSRAYHQQHLEEQRAKMREYQREHRAEANARSAKYLRTDKGKADRIAIAHNRRFADGGKLTRQLVEQVRASSGNICPYCNKPITVGHIDHIVPVSRGGTNLMDNLAWVCAPCNQSKNSHSLLEFLVRRVTA